MEVESQRLFVYICMTITIVCFIFSTASFLSTPRHSFSGWDGVYLYNTTTEMYINETVLNYTIDKNGVDNNEFG